MRKLLFLAMLCPLLCAGQQPNKITSLTIGDTLPDIALSNIINYKTPSAKLSSFKDKLVLLDFFATWCSSCIKELPKLDSLQKKYGPQLQVLLVTTEPLQKIEALRKKNKRFAACSLPIVYADSVLHQRFPRKFIPHEVWIDPQGRVAAITDAAQVTEANLLAVLSGAPVTLPLKQDLIDFKAAIPFLQNPHIAQHLNYGAAFAPYIPNIGSTQGRTTKDATTRYYFINTPLLALYQKAWDFAPNRLVLELPCPERFSKAMKDKEEWKRHNLVCYELLLPSAAPPGLAFSYMRRDLEHFTNLHGRVESRKTKCWALVCAGTPPPTTGKSPFIGPDSIESYRLFTNQPIAALVEAINTDGFPIIIDETDLAYHLDLRLPNEVFHSLTTLARVLIPYGFTLVPVERELEVFVLSETNSTE